MTLAWTRAPTRTCSPNAPFVRDRRTPADQDSGMSKIIVIGAGPVGSHTSALLASKGHHVTLVSRRGGSSTNPRIEHVSADARDSASLRRAAQGARTIVNCAMPAYNRWPEEFPQIGMASLSVAAEVGATLVTLSNVYGYGRVSGPIREDTALSPHTVKGRVRAGMWDLVQRRSDVQGTEVRASDYLGQGAVTYFSLFVLPGIRTGEESAFPGNLDTPHSWSYTKDVAATLVAAVGSAASWGRVWHVPSHATSVRHLASATARLVNRGEPRLRRLRGDELQGLAAADSMMREVAEMSYLFDEPCILDSAQTQEVLGVTASPMEEALLDTLR